MHDSSETPLSPSRLPGPVPRTPAQAATSRANAQASTGPRTRLGKLHIRHNGVRHGLYTSRAPMMGERRRDYAHVLERLATEFQPATPFEESLVSRAASLVWRLGRVPAAENALFESFGAEAAQVLQAADDDEAAEADAAAPREVGVDLLWGLAFRSGMADSPVNRLARWERGLHRQLREVMAELRASKLARAELRDAAPTFSNPDQERAEAYTQLDTMLAFTDNCFTRQELEDEVIRLRALLAARDRLPPPLTPVHARGQVPLRRMEEIQAQAFTGHIKGSRNDDKWTPAADEVARLRSLVEVAGDVEPFRPERPADELERERREREEAAWAAELARRDNRRDPPPVRDDIPIDREPRFYARNPSPEEAARGLPEKPRGPRADTAIMHGPKMPSR